MFYLKNLKTGSLAIGDTVVMAGSLLKESDHGKVVRTEKYYATVMWGNKIKTSERYEHLWLASVTEPVPFPKVIQESLAPIIADEMQSDYANDVLPLPVIPTRIFPARTEDNKPGPTERDIRLANRLKTPAPKATNKKVQGTGSIMDIIPDKAYVDIPTMPEWLTVEQAAESLQLSISSIRNYIKNGNLVATRIAGRRVMRIKKSDLLKLLIPVTAEEFEGEQPEGLARYNRESRRREKVSE